MARALEHAVTQTLDAHNRRCTFDGRIADLERLCRRHLDPSRVPEVETKAWYARVILATIEDVHVATVNGDVQLALSLAVVVGALAADADARFHWPAVTRWRRVVAQLRDQSVTAVRVRRENAARDADALLRDVVAQELAHPDWSMNRIACALLTAHGRGYGYRTLAKRIARLRKY